MTRRLPTREHTPSCHRATGYSSSIPLSKLPPTNRPSTFATKRRSRSIKPSDVVGARVGAQTIRLEKSGEEWKLVKPIQAPADFVSVSGVIGQLQSAQMTAPEGLPRRSQGPEQGNGLDKPAVVATLGSGASSVKFELGKEADTGSVWGRDPAKAAVFSINNGVRPNLRKPSIISGERKFSTSARWIPHDSRLRAARIRARSSVSRAPAQTRSTHGSRSRLRQRRWIPATSKVRCSISSIFARRALSPPSGRREPVLAQQQAAGTHRGEV